MANQGAAVAALPAGFSQPIREVCSYHATITFRRRHPVSFPSTDDPVLSREMQHEHSYHHTHMTGSISTGCR
jgi:hypothetical protein